MESLRARLLAPHTPVVSRGFTLVELMVVMAIIAIITSIALSSQSSFNTTLIGANTAYDIALTFRSAETYGLGSRVAGTVVDTGYGLHFERANPSSFVLFADTYPDPSTTSPCHPASDPSSPAAQPGNCSYDATEGEKIQTYNLGNGIQITDFCADVSGSWACANGGSASLSSLDIVFSRPNPDAFIAVNGAYDSSAPVSAACLSVGSPQGGSHYVSISGNGEVTANATSCP